MIIAIRDKDRFIIGISNRKNLLGYSNKTLTHPDNIPMKVTSKGLVLSDSPSLSTDFVLYDDRLIPDDQDFHYSSIVNTIAPRIYRKLDFFSLLEKKEKQPGVAYMDSDYLFINQDHLYVLDAEFQAYEVDDFFCSTMNCQRLNASLELTKGEDPITRIQKAYKHMEEYEGVLSFPILIFASNDQKVTLLERK